MKGFIGVHSDGWNFINMETDDVFIPFGANYFDPETGWAPKLWQKFDKDKVEEHFHKMADVGVNVARVFLTAASFQPEPDLILTDGLEKLDAMIEIAKRSGIRLILTGPDHWEGVPNYWKPDKYAGEPALEALEHFWNGVAYRYKDEPTIFAWDLLNEPEIPWKSETMRKKWQDWLMERYKNTSSLVSAWGSIGNGETIETAGIPQDRSNAGDQRLYDYQLFRESIAWEWTRRQVSVIRSIDPSHLITIGLIQWSFPLVRTPWGENAHQPGRYSAFNPRKLASLLDFISVHFYPILGDPGEPEQALSNTRYLQAVLNYCYVGKPVVLEEYGWHGGGEINGIYRTEAYQSAWNTNAVESTIGLAGGWLVWAFCDTPSSTDLTKYGGLYNIEGELKEWGRSFSSLAQKITTKKKLDRIDIKDVELDEREVLTGDVDQLFVRYIEESGISQLK